MTYGNSRHDGATLRTPAQRLPSEGPIARTLCHTYRFYCLCMQCTAILLPLHAACRPAALRIRSRIQLMYPSYFHANLLAFLRGYLFYAFLLRSYGGME